MILIGFEIAYFKGGTKMEEKITSVFKPGDIVLFQNNGDCFKRNIGMILKLKENGNYVVLGTNKCAYKNIECSWVADVNNAKCIRNEIRNYYESEIAILQD